MFQSLLLFSLLGVALMEMEKIELVKWPNEETQNLFCKIKNTKNPSFEELENELRQANYLDNDIAKNCDKKIDCLVFCHLADEEKRKIILKSQNTKFLKIKKILSNKVNNVDLDIDKNNLNIGNGDKLNFKTFYYVPKATTTVQNFEVSNFKVDNIFLKEFQVKNTKCTVTEEFYLISPFSVVNKDDFKKSSKSQYECKKTTQTDDKTIQTDDKTIQTDDKTTQTDGKKNSGQVIGMNISIFFFTISYFVSIFI